MSERFDITGLDIGILIGYLVLSRIIPLLLSGKKEDADDYFLGGRNFVWPLIGFSLFATNMSGASFVGLAGAGYSQGISVYSYEWMTSAILVIFIFFILPFYLRSGAFTMPEFLEKRYGRNSRLAFSSFNLIAMMVIDMASALYAGGLVFRALFPVIPLWVTILALALLAGVYTIFGGLGAVVISDTIQAIVLFIGGTIVAVLTFAAIPSWQAVVEAAPPGGLHIILPANNPDLPWPGLLTGVIVIGTYYWTTNQVVVQRTLGARSLDHGRFGAIFAGFLKIPLLFLMILPGTMALTLYPNLENPDLVFPTLAFDLLPVGIRGVILAAVVAAITSTVDSVLNSASTLFTMDFVRTFRPNTSQRALVAWGRFATGGALIIAVLWAPQISRFGTLYAYLQSLLSYVTPPIVAVFIMGVLWKRATKQAAFATLATLIPLGAVGFILVQVMGFVNIQFLYAAGIMFASGLLIMTVVSLLTPPPPREVTDNLVWHPRLWREETEELRGKPWYMNYRYWSVALLVVTAAVVIWWA
jgi:solute:Na+ symporter, SSS family